MARKNLEEGKVKQQGRIDELVENFELLGDWEERFGYLIELGKNLPQLEPEEKIETNRVYGCQATVYLRMIPAPCEPPVFTIRADADAFIVKGLISILLLLYDNKTAQEIIKTNSLEVFRKLGLDKHLTMTRRNGLNSMVERIDTLAKESWFR
jgi:cysteine desulfuration protein SufE